MTGLRAAMTRVINKYIEEHEIAKKAKVDISGDDMREGLACVLSVKMPGPEVRVSDQDETCLVGSAASGRGSRRGTPDRIPPGATARRQGDYRQDRRSSACARRRPQGPRNDAPQGIARRSWSAPENWPIARKRIPHCANSIWSRATQLVVRQNRDATENSQAILPLKGKILNVEKGAFRQADFLPGNRHPDYRARHGNW